MEKKYCSKCKKLQEITQFYIRKSVDKPLARCKSCVVEDNNIYRLINYKAYYKKNRERLIANSLERYYANKPLYAKYRERFRERHPTYWADYYQAQKAKRNDKRKALES